MRLVTWNAARGRFAKKAPMIDHLFADVAVIQEVAEPESQDERTLWFGDNPHQGLAVVARPPYRLEPLPAIEGSPKYVVPVRVDGPTSFVLFGAWTLGQQQHRYVRALSVAVDLYRDTFASQTALVLGDFNSNAIWDKHHPQGLNHSALVKRLREHGLHSAYHHARGLEHGQETEHTFYLRKRRTLGYHIDYCFLPERWLPAIRHVDVGTYAAWYKASDHCPLLVEVGAET